MLGEKRNWVQNVRAADERAVLRHRRAIVCRLVEVPISQYPQIVRPYLQKVPGAPAGTLPRCSPLTPGGHGRAA
jgi:hypothetical protein